MVVTCSPNISTPCVLATTWFIVFDGSIHGLILTLNKLKCPSGFATKNYFMIELVEHDKSQFTSCTSFQSSLTLISRRGTAIYSSPVDFFPSFKTSLTPRRRFSYILGELLYHQASFLYLFIFFFVLI